MHSHTIERWKVFELSLDGPAAGNPFTDVTFSAQFKYRNRVLEPDGFYDGEGVYRIRLMPDMPGVWTYVTKSNHPELDGHTGEFTCTEASPENHGPVRVRNTYHFAYADGTPYRQIGTTCYAWVHQGDILEEQTLATLKDTPFNKMRMCVFPKHYIYNANEPVHYPFERDQAGQNDLTRFDLLFFRHFERRVEQLDELGIEADIILFHPYDRWGFATMPAEVDDCYLRYTVARLAAYRNVWWSLANEYDLMRAKSMADWDRFFRIIQERDPYQHLRSIHNCYQFYDHNKPWVTHCSVQHSDLEQVAKWRDLYRKPVIVDECGYEGNIEKHWGNLSAQEMVRRFWLGTVHGGYVGHGETYLHPEDILWWSKGSQLHGQSVPRIAFLRSILEQGPVDGLDPMTTIYPNASGREGKYYLIYYGLHQPAEQTLELPGGPYRIDIIDTWEMTITPLERFFEDKSQIQLPGKPDIAVRIQKA
ncbi:MAG: DUF5060 domain-containing protein [Anaerolineae bacterium]|nr:DUF5060 domain-containing protein [Anaerolineae bacterium]